MKRIYTKEELQEKIKQCNGDMFLIYGYVKMLEELGKETDLTPLSER